MNIRYRPQESYGNRKVKLVNYEVVLFVPQNPKQVTKVPELCVSNPRGTLLQWRCTRTLEKK